MRKVVSLTSFLSFVALVWTSVVLYIVPHGRVAYWSDWRLWGLSKDQWTGLHINLGVLFIIAILLHLYLNWKPMLSYLKNKYRKMKIFTKEFNIALALVIIFIVGTYYYVPPFSSILNFSEKIKEISSEKYGEPPYGHAELSNLKVLSKRLQLDVNVVLNKLRNAGIKLKNNNQTLLSIANENNMSPAEIYNIIKDAKIAPKQNADESNIEHKLPEVAKPGLGKLTVKEFSELYKLEPNKVISLLKNIGFSNVNAESKLKDVAEAKGKTPMDIFYIVKENYK